MVIVTKVLLSNLRDNQATSRAIAAIHRYPTDSPMAKKTSAVAAEQDARAARLGTDTKNMRHVFGFLDVCLRKCQLNAMLRPHGTAPLGIFAVTVNFIKRGERNVAAEGIVFIPAVISLRWSLPRSLPRSLESSFGNVDLSVEFLDQSGRGGASFIISFKRGLTSCLECRGAPALGF